MTASSASSCTCTLLVLLLPLLFCIHRSSCAALVPPAGKTPPPCISSMSQLNVDVDYLGRSVKNCSTDCSSLNITDTACQCLNLSVSQDCGPRDFLLSGLKALRPRLLDNLTVSSLVNRLRRLSADCTGKATFCSLHVPSKVLISPKSFHKKMEALVEEYNAALHAQ